MPEVKQMRAMPRGAHRSSKGEEEEEEAPAFTREDMDVTLSGKNRSSSFSSINTADRKLGQVTESFFHQGRHSLSKTKTEAPIRRIDSPASSTL